jgi:hypothetical protein
VSIALRDLPPMVLGSGRGGGGVTTGD